MSRWQGRYSAGPRPMGAGTAFTMPVKSAF